MVPENKKKKDTNKLTTLAFKMISILHNTLLATPKLKFYSGTFTNFWGPPNPATTIFIGPNSNFTLWAFTHFGAHWGLLVFRGPKSNFISGAFTHL
jgi:hypothetical protein